MKCRFVNVWDDSRAGRVRFIVLQVEETDTFLTKVNFNPGYKFIIQATYHRVGAAGGHTFIPYYGESVQKISQKLDSVESDILGFYLSYINDIYDVPENLYTDNFWNVIHTVQNDNYEDEFDNDDYYKALILQHRQSFNSMRTQLESLSLKNISSDFCTSIMEANQKMADFLTRIDADLDQEHDDLTILFINKQSLKIDGYEKIYGFSDEKSIIAKYLWLPNEEITPECWERVKEKETQYYGDYDYTDGQLYFSET